jgi:hypothetical protein
MHRPDDRHVSVAEGVVNVNHGRQNDGTALAIGTLENGAACVQVRIAGNKDRFVIR